MGNVDGEISLAAIGATTTPINFFITIITGFTLGLSVLIAKNSSFLTAIVIPTGGKIIALFGAGPDAVKIGSGFFQRIACFYPVYGLATAFRSYLEGKGDLLYFSMAEIAALTVRIIASYAMVSFWGNMVIAYAGHACLLCICCGLYRKVRQDFQSEN